MTARGAGTAALLDPQLALFVDELAKTYRGAHEARYEPAVSLFALLRERRGETVAGRRPVGTENVAGDEDDDEEVDEELEQPVDELSSLRNVSFEVRRGEAVGIVGDQPSAVRTLARVLCGMTAPSSGRILVRGRVAPTVELALLLTRRETSARSAARLLAVLAGPGRRHRRDYVGEALALSFGQDLIGADLARAPKQVLHRIAVAASLDPFAELLVIDAFPALDDRDFRQRCLARLAERLEQGAAAVITSADPALLELCGQIVRLEDGRVSSAPPPPLDAGTEPALEQPEPTSKPDVAGTAMAAREPSPPRKKEPVQVRAFDEHAAVLAATVVDSDGSPLEVVRSEDELRVRIHFETLTEADVMVVVRFAGEASFTFVREQESLAPGSYAAHIRLPAAAIEPGNYDLAVGLVLEHAGRTKVGRERAASVRVEADEEGLALVAETGSVPPRADSAVPSDPEWSLESVDE